MDDLNRKKLRQPGDDEQAGTPSREAAAPPPDSVAAHRPAARKRRTSAAVERALSILATGQAPAPSEKAPVDKAPSRPKLVRTSFSLAKDDYLTLGELKDACRAQGVGAKKSQLLRVAVGLLRELEPARLAELVADLPPARKAK